MTRKITLNEEFERKGMEFWAPVVLTRPEKFKNAALFLRLDRASTRKRSSDWRNLKTLTLCFSVDGNHSENEAFREQWRHDHNHDFPLPELYSNTNSKKLFKIASDCCLFKFLRRSVEGKHLTCFRRENTVFKFIWCTAHGALDIALAHYVFYQSKTVALPTKHYWFNSIQVAT